MRYHFTPSQNANSQWLEWLLSKRPQITNVGEDMEKKEP